jgi:pilus assembly protein CpaC
MDTNRFGKNEVIRLRLASRRSLLACALSCGAAVMFNSAQAQVPEPPQPASSLPPAMQAAPQTGIPPQLNLQAGAVFDSLSTELPRISLDPPRPPGGARAVSSFVDGLKGNDATFEVVLGQGRILTVKEDLVVAGREGLIAVGDPSVIDFYIVNPRKIRITGRRVGVTDLSISTAKGNDYSFEVRVVADFSELRARLRANFPDASIKLDQIRNQVIVEGEARDNAQVQRIIDTIRAYLQSNFIQGGAPGTGGGQFLPVSGQGMPGTGGQLPGPGVPSGPVGPPAPDQTVPPAPRPGLDQGVAPAAFMQMQGGSQGGPTQAFGMAGMQGPLGGGPGEPQQAVNVQAGLPAGFGTAALQAPVAGTGGAQNALWTVVNLLRVPGSQQVMLKVRIAELNRTAFRAIGSNFLGIDPKTGSIVGSQITGSAGATGTITPGFVARNQLPGRLVGSTTEAITPLSNTGGTTVFGIFRDGNFMFTLEALRRNSLLKILAEPNLVAFNGQLANFVAGGEFPVPVPQVGAAGVAPVVTVRFKEFGVRLGFVPYILDGDRIRLTVAPEVSQIDFSIAVTLVQGGSPVPGLNTRKALTTVELEQGETLAIAGLLQLQMDGTTQRIPGLGDLPIIGPFFSNTTGDRIEKELVVLVTPYLVEPMSHDQVPPTPGDEVKEPNDLELYFLNRIEGRTGTDFRSTTKWDDVFHLRDLFKLERRYIQGPVGFSD